MGADRFEPVTPALVRAKELKPSDAAPPAELDKIAGQARGRVVLGSLTVARSLSLLVGFLFPTRFLQMALDSVSFDGLCRPGLRTSPGSS